MLVKFTVYEYRETDACIGIVFQSVGKRAQWFRIVWFSRDQAVCRKAAGRMTLEVEEELMVRRFNSVAWRQKWTLTHECKPEPDTEGSGDPDEA